MTLAQASRPVTDVKAASAAATPVDGAPDYVRNLPPYVTAKPASQVQMTAGVTRLRKMASNENPNGASPKALAAAAAVLTGAATYPDPFGSELKAALHARFGVPPESLVIGNGSSELLELAARCFMRAGDEAVYSQYSFIGYPHAVKSMGGRGVVVPAVDFGHDLPAMLRAITPRTRLIFVANPNNPTGTLLAPEAITHFLEQVPPHVLVVLDEAYTEYLEPAQRMDSFGLIQRFANLVVMRTFSKAYGLAGLRVGFAAAQPQVAELINRTRLVFNVNAPAQAAALAALADEDFLALSAHGNREGMKLLQDAFHTLGLPYIPSWGNFIAVDLSSVPGGLQGVNAQLLAAGFLLRPLGPYGLPNHLRITVGLPEDNAALVAALTACVKP
jgi:histidinol-phosphate aminotransferase